MRTLFTALTAAAATLILAPTAIAARLLRLPDGRRSVAQWCMRTWARSIAAAAGARIVVHGAENISPTRGAVYACNHVSLLDVVAVASVLPRYTFIAKAELRKVPLFGWGAEAAGVVFLTRENRKAAFDSYRDAAREVSRGRSVVVFPEGTRGLDYHLRPFKKGPFVLAIAAGAPIVPVVIHGALEMTPKGKFQARANTVHLHFLEPFETAGFDYERRHEAMREVWERMAACLREEYGVGTTEHPIAESTANTA
jgi:1-acyl-sn-glycerol-3-phosphate acyltransferase